MQALPDSLCSFCCRFHRHYWVGLAANQSSTPGSPVATGRFLWLDPLAAPLARPGAYQKWGT
jgi:hypothetical protein